MLAKPLFKVFDDKDWVYERKIDGYRIIAYTGKNVSLISRNLVDYTEKFKSISLELSKIKEIAVLDGEIAAEDKNGKQIFSLLQNDKNREGAVSLKYYVFDLLSLNGNEVMQLPLIQRKKLLFKLLQNYYLKKIIYLPDVVEYGVALFEKAKNEKWEGIVAKNANEEYYSGKRTNYWLKFKVKNSLDAIVCGYTKPENSRKYFGALVLARYDQNQNLNYIGNCGTGFNDDKLKDIYQKLNLIKSEIKPFKEAFKKENQVTWVNLKYVCEVYYSEWTVDKHLRHPVFKGLRTDQELVKK